MKKKYPIKLLKLDESIQILESFKVSLPGNKRSINRLTKNKQRLDEVENKPGVKVGIMNKISYLYLWIKHRVFKSIQ
jgi:hypothetical protein